MTPLFTLKFRKFKTKVDFYGRQVMVREAAPTDTFWRAWKRSKKKLKQQGYSVTRNLDNGKWLVRHYTVLVPHYECAAILELYRDQILAHQARKAQSSALSNAEPPPWD